MSLYIVSHGSSSIMGLQDLPYRINLLELELGFQLECIHVLSHTIICQGANSLSRGLWISHERLWISPEDNTIRIFQRVPLSLYLLYCVLSSIDPFYPIS